MTSASAAIAYVDSSALVKLAVPEAESMTLEVALNEYTGVFTSQIALVEVARATTRAGQPTANADAVLGRFGTVAVDADVIRMARTLEPPALRTLDAIHLASALSLRLDGLTFVAYDERLLQAARAAGLPTSAPGR